MKNFRITYLRNGELKRTVAEAWNWGGIVSSACGAGINEEQMLEIKMIPRDE